jgi:hypothetical protein
MGLREERFYMTLLHDEPDCLPQSLLRLIGDAPRGKTPSRFLVGWLVFVLQGGPS